MTADELHRELLLERFGPVPWAERHRKPLPVTRPRRLVRTWDPPAVTRARRRVLLDALAEKPHAREEAA